MKDRLKVHAITDPIPLQGGKVRLSMKVVDQETGKEITEEKKDYSFSHKNT